MGDPGDGPANIAAIPQRTVNPLQRLIQGRLSERGWSYGEVARRGGLPRSTVYTLATTQEPGAAAAPGHDRRARQGARGAGLGGPRRGGRVDRDALLRRAREGSGRGAGGDQERELLIASIDELSAEDRRHVAALVESLRNRSAPPGDQ